MEFAEVVRRRRMIRAYDSSRPVPRELVSTLLEYAIHAPSAGFSQGWRFLVLDTAQSCERFWAVTTKPGELPDSWLAGMQAAPVLIVTLSDKTTYLDRYAEADKGWTDRDEARWPVPYWHIDTGMAALLILLGAVDEGLGACFFGIPPEHWDSFRTAFSVPARLDPVGVVSLGYRVSDQRSPSLKRGRRAVDDVAVFNSFAD